MRRLGVDPGSVRTGIAVADDDVPVATPLVTVTHRTRQQAVQRIAEIARERAVGEIVLGLPLSMGGREGEAARRARHFALELEAATQLPVLLWDERLSSALAERALRAQGKTSRERRSVVDQAAAALLLQSYLDSKRTRTWQDDEPPPVDAPDRSRGRKR
jgi:putative holliday junction resolvase